MDVGGKRVAVLGLARTGVAAALFLARQGARVTASDLKMRESLEMDLGQLEKEGVRLVLGGHPERIFVNSQLVIQSPGVPSDLAVLKKAEAAGAEVISELELAYRYLSIPLIAVTGTNGKSTTTTLLGQMFANAGKKAFVGGNLGTPLIQAVDEPSMEYAIAEVSSFQLERIRRFRPRISLFLNLSADHLDRHANYQDYVQAKARIFMNQRGEDTAVVNGDDPEVMRIFPRGRMKSITFGRDKGAVSLKQEGIIARVGKEERFYPLRAPGLRGAHNQENAMAAVAAAELCKLEPEAIARALGEFPGLPHRLEFVREFGGVSYFNDSKATNVGAVKRSLSSFSNPVVLIAGGRDKGCDYRPLLPEVERRVRVVVLLGEAKERMKRDLGASIKTELADDLKQAVLKAKVWAKRGDVVLLSPACSSFDMFANFEERGESFKDLVSRLH
ncbi:MAG: UDP-N-acetylmuramoyl-L-alanine--D-glutamate ligase [Thermodesulfobacteriota bacterium]